ncbi:MAG: Hsp20/alpha crystallin family protein, partial [Cyclobacteriaceae bacterium]
MKTDVNLTTKLALIANTSNTVGGGMVETNAVLIKKNDHYLISIKVPGITEGDLRIEINNDMVFVFLCFDDVTKEPFNYLLKHFKIPFEVDAEQIRADFEGRILDIIMPFKEMENGYFRTVDIN